MKVININDGNFEEKVMKSKLPFFVDFFAEWCGPCKMAAPVIEELAGDYGGKVVIGKIDVDKNQETSAKFGVMSIPTVIMFKDGKEVDRKSGFAGKAGYEEIIKKNI
jgi:thioredoxin 1